jgi:hypothetical protein
MKDVLHNTKLLPGRSAYRFPFFLLALRLLPAALLGGAPR